MVPGGGFEPPTRGFSIRCSTPELPGQSIGTVAKFKTSDIEEYRQKRARYTTLFA